MTEPAIPHTPGPWEIVPTVHSYRKHIFHRDPINAYYIGTLIAGSPKDLAIFRANFRLIGTAPELLKALETLISRADDILAAIDGATDQFEPEAAALSEAASLGEKVLIKARRQA